MEGGHGLRDGDTPSLASVHEVKLEAMLHDLIREHGTMQTAKTLGVNNKTLSRSIESGKLSVHLREALMARLLARKDFGTRDQERSRSLEQALDRLAEELRDGLQELRKEVRTGFSSMEEKQVRGFEKMSKQVHREKSDAGTMSPLSGTHRAWPRKSQPRQTFRRTHPSVVTIEGQEGDETVYGTAWSPVQEWRELRLSHPYEGSGISWLVSEIRLRRLEVLLIGEYELTLPPDTDPWDGLERKTQVGWRYQTLARLHRELFWARVRRWVRRVLTLGIWSR